MIRGRDVRAGLRAGGLWLAGSVILIIIGRVGGADWGSVIGLLLVPFGLLGAPGQVAVAWGNFQKPAAGFNGFVAGTLAGLGNAVAVLIIGAPLAVNQLYGPGASNLDVPWIAYSPVVMIVYLLAMLCFIFTIYTSVTLAIVEAPAAELELPPLPPPHERGGTA